MASEFTEGVVLQCAFALGQGAGPGRLVRREALLQIRDELMPLFERIDESVWETEKDNFLRRFQLMGEKAAAGALEKSTEVIDHEHLRDAIIEVGRASRTAYCSEVFNLLGRRGA